MKEDVFIPDHGQPLCGEPDQSTVIATAALAGGLTDVFERPFTDPDDPRLQCSRVLTRSEAEAILEHRGDLAKALSSDWIAPDTRPPERPGTYISVRVIETYRWLPYKPDGARQMRRKGRWQKFDGYGFTNAEPPEGAEWKHLENGKDGDQ